MTDTLAGVSPPDPAKAGNADERELISSELLVVADVPS